MSKRREFIKQLKNEGWSFLGEGHFSVAYGKGDRVLKVSHRNRDGKGPSNDAYVAFASWVVLNGNANPHLPKIYSLEIIHDNEDEDEDGTFYTVELERLTPLTDYDNDSEEYSLFNAAKAGFHGRSLSRILDTDEDGEEFTHTPDTEALRNCECGGCRHQLRAWEAFKERRDAEGTPEARTHDPRMVAAFEAGEILREAFEGVASFDLHDGNAMIRETAEGSQLVITDPLAWVSDYSTQQEWMTAALSALNPQYSLPF